MSYQQPPYQTTVMQPVVVQPVQPVVVPVVSGHNTRPFRGPAFLRNGAKLGSFNVPGQCICCMSIFGGVFLFQFIIVGITTGRLMPSIFSIFGFIAVPLVFITCYLCIAAKKNYDIQRSQESTAPYSEPFTDVGNSQGYVYSGSGQPNFGQPITAPPQYVPVPPGVPPPYPQQTSGMTYPNASSYPQPGMPYVPGGFQYPEAPSYSGPEKSFQPEYGQPPSYAPPKYSP